MDLNHVKLKECDDSGRYKLTNECSTLKTQIEGIDTLCVNNIEIPGLVDPGVDSVTNEPESVEKVILECINGLNPLQSLTPADINICHELPNRESGKTHVVQFVNRKTKNIIMEAKKERNNRQYTFRDKTIYINIIMEAKKERNNRQYTFRDKTTLMSI